jgi:hypothetical protein
MPPRPAMPGGVCFVNRWEPFGNVEVSRKIDSKYISQLFENAAPKPSLL